MVLFPKAAQIKKWLIKNKSLAVIFGLGVLIIILASIVILNFTLKKSSASFSSQASFSRQIVLTPDGFSPSEITIPKGTTVTFTTTDTKPFWPASDLHPSHLIYPEFDPKKPIPADKSWSFTFDKVGTWPFHDHLFPAFRGKIIVTDQNTSSAQEETFQDDCQRYTEYSQKSKCWDFLITQSLQTEGLDKTFALFEKLFNNDPQFASDCHGLAHKLGEKAFDLFNTNKDFSLSAKAYYCGYGFYHGFMEKLVHVTNDMNQARRFCDLADQKLQAQTLDAGGACYHGIGHGLVEDVPDPSLWGKPLAIAQKGLDLCEQVSINESQLFRCSSGVFNALEIISDAKKYNLSVDPSDPFAVCKVQLDKYKEACYVQYVVSVMAITNNDFAKSAAIIATIPDDKSAQSSLSALIVEKIRLGQTDYKSAVDFCRGLPDKFQITCTTSFAEGFMKYGPPQQEYVKALDFCGSNLLNPAEKKDCYNRILSILRIWYTADKSQQICRSVDPNYQIHNCDYN